MTVDDHSLGLRLGVAAVLTPLLLVPFALIAAFVVGDWPPLHELDATVTDGLHRFAEAHPFWVGVMLVWSWVFGPMPLRVAALVLLIWLIRRRHAPRLALWVAVTMTVGGVLAALIKLLVGRDRPELLDPVARAAGYSFPSGHSANAALTAGVFLLVLLPFTRDRTGRRVALWAAAIVVTLVTGLSRIILGVHWTSDVLAGWLLGVAVVAATTVAFHSRRTRRGGRSAPATVEGLEPDLAEPTSQRSGGRA
ncbi:MAG TPA: phosphatase PAP2 family protein [Actinoplanes sp.]|nr:phosphatase PAP2 family protein [Actinoplanes sp.]